jgi:hypothetical protein
MSVLVETKFNLRYVWTTNMNVVNYLERAVLSRPVGSDCELHFPTVVPTLMIPTISTSNHRAPVFHKCSCLPLLESTLQNQNY